MLLDSTRPSIELEEQIRRCSSSATASPPTTTGPSAGFNRDKSFKRFQALFFGIRTLTWVVGVMTLFAGAIGVSNIMMIAVAERTREIGIRKAIGATPASIMGQIVAEATVLTGLAGYLGLCAGVGLLQLAAKVVAAMPAGAGPRFFSSPEIDSEQGGAGRRRAHGGGGPAGLAPARAAVAVRPVEALAHE